MRPAFDIECKQMVDWMLRLECRCDWPPLGTAAALAGAPVPPQRAPALAADVPFSLPAPSTAAECHRCASPVGPSPASHPMLAALWRPNRQLHRSAGASIRVVCSACHRTTHSAGASTQVVCSACHRTTHSAAAGGGGGSACTSARSSSGSWLCRAAAGCAAGQLSRSLGCSGAAGSRRFAGSSGVL